MSGNRRFRDPLWWGTARRLFQAGVEKRDIAETFDVTVSMVQKVLSGEVYHRRNKKPSKDISVPLPAPEPIIVDQEEIRRLAVKHVPITHIAALLHVPYAEVYKAVGSSI